MAGNTFPEFQPFKDEWPIYRERLDNYFIANFILEDRQKVAFLLLSIGDYTYKVLRNLMFPVPLQNMKYDTLVKVLNKHFTVEVNVWCERKKFFELKQGEGEAVADWFGRVKRVAIPCKFGNSMDYMMVNKFMTGLIQGKIQDRIFEEDINKSCAELVSLSAKLEKLTLLNPLAPMSKSAEKDHGYYWRDFYYGKIPEDAYCCGEDNTGKCYIGQCVYFPQGMFTGKLYEGARQCPVPAYGVKTNAHAMKILCCKNPNKMQWINNVCKSDNDFKDGSILIPESNPIYGGYDSKSNSRLMISRQKQNGEILIGVWRDGHLPYFAYRGSEASGGPFTYLTYNNIF
ncbi:unnamed protein product [Brassicogethes aeneus]|uniref:Uncharacterized protein n=1 Tax=Brassicogethes aeneus TaxID=1431903 RepID=A0A9P0B6W2_BRAAE|nr:unnamed protein product [Brassicogethes aeneus]